MSTLVRNVIDLLTIADLSVPEIWAATARLTSLPELFWTRWSRLCKNDVVDKVDEYKT